MTHGGDGTALRAVSRDGTEIGYFRSGNGPPLLLVHGALGDHSRWDRLRPYLERHATVYAMDRRGRGASGDHPDYAVEREFEDVAAVVDAIAEVAGARVDVAGSSAGAAFALASAALTPNIGRLVLFEPPTGAVAALVPDELKHRLAELLARGDREAILVTAYRAIAGLSDAEIDALRAQPAWTNRLAAAHTVPRELGASPHKLFDPGQASNVSVPALLLVGSETPEPFRRSAEEIAGALPNARVTLLEGQGHAAEMFAPELVAGEMLAFLRAG